MGVCQKEYCIDHLLEKYSEMLVEENHAQCKHRRQHAGECLGVVGQTLGRLHMSMDHEPRPDSEIGHEQQHNRSRDPHRGISLLPRLHVHR